MSFSLEPYPTDDRILIVTFPTGMLDISILEHVMAETRQYNHYQLVIGYVVIVRGLVIDSANFSRIANYVTTNMRPNIPRVFIGVSAPLRSFFWVYQRFTRNDPVYFSETVEHAYSQILRHHQLHDAKNT